MLCNNADVRRCSYFELGLSVVPLDKICFLVSVNEIKFPCNISRLFSKKKIYFIVDRITKLFSNKPSGSKFS